MYSTNAKGVRYMEMAEGYVLKTALDENDEVCGYQFVKLGKMLEDIRHGVEPNEAYKTTSVSTVVLIMRLSTLTLVKNNSVGGHYNGSYI